MSSGTDDAGEFLSGDQLHQIYEAHKAQQEAKFAKETEILDYGAWTTNVFDLAFAGKDPDGSPMWSVHLPPQCHPTSGTKVYYRSPAGVLYLRCAHCELLIGYIKVAESVTLDAGDQRKHYALAAKLLTATPNAMTGEIVAEVLKMFKGQVNASAVKAFVEELRKA